jgi:adenylate cyclase
LVETHCGSAGMLLTCYKGMDDKDSAERTARMLFERTERAVAQDKSNGAALSLGASALAELGENERAKEWMRRALLVDPDNRLMRYNLACIYATTTLNDADAAIDLLQPYMTHANSGQLRHVAADPDLDSLRDNPRFRALLAEANARIVDADEP